MHYRKRPPSIEKFYSENHEEKGFKSQKRKFVNFRQYLRQRDRLQVHLIQLIIA